MSAKETAASVRAWAERIPSSPERSLLFDAAMHLESMINVMEDGPGSPGGRLNWIINELETRFPGVVKRHMSHPVPEVPLLAAIDAALSLKTPGDAT